MLTLFFKGVLASTLSTIPIILLLTVATPFLSKRYSPHLRYVLWLVVALRLLIPVSLQNGARFIIPTGDAVYYLENDTTAIARAFAEAEQSIDMMAGTVSQVGGGVLSWIGILAMIWFAGVILYLLIHGAAYLYTAKRISRWSKSVHDVDVLTLLERVKTEVSVSGNVGLYKCPLITTPMLIGFISPRIVLPSTDISQTNLRYIFCHELMHYRRRDLWYKILFLLVGAVHWFNPAIWLMNKYAESDMELACDRNVLDGIDNISRKEYGFSILSFVHSGRREYIPLTTCFSSNKTHTKQRFVEIVNTTTKRKGLPVLCMAAAFILLSGLLIGYGTLTSTAASPPPLTSAATGEPALPDEADMLNSDMIEKNRIKLSEQEQEIAAMLEKLNSSDNPYIGGELVWPVPEFYTITSAYGIRFDGKDFHTGIDINGPDAYGHPVIAAGDGKVSFVNTEYEPGLGYGIYIVIDHGDGIATLYSQLSEVNVESGVDVKAGQVIGKIGSTGFSTGPHLHFEVRENGNTVNPQNYFVPSDTEVSE